MRSEIEARFVFFDKDALRNKLKNEGFKLIQPECLMKRKVYRLPHKDDSYYARVRDEGNRITATVKHINATAVDGVEEAEVVVSSFEEAHNMFTMIGLEAKAYQETKRELWQHGDVEAMIDTWPGLPPFVEIEGNSEDDIKQIAEALGFNWEDAGFGAVDGFYQKYTGCTREEINSCPEITFANPPKSKL